MKKLFLSLALIFSLVLTLSACGTSNNNTAAEDEADQEMEEESTEVDHEVTKPTSDVVGGTGIQGTWTATYKADDATNDIVLALNSDNTYGIWYGEQESSDQTEGVSATEFDGTYSDDGSNIEFTPDIVDEATDYPIGDGSNPYTLDGNTLTIKADGTDIVFTRES